MYPNFIHQRSLFSLRRKSKLAIQTNWNHFELSRSCWRLWPGVLSVSKCSFSVFSDRGVSRQIADLLLGFEQSINHASNLKFLGVILDDNITFIPYYKMITRKCDALLNKLAIIQSNV